MYDTHYYPPPFSRRLGLMSGDKGYRGYTHIIYGMWKTYDKKIRRVCESVLPSVFIKQIIQ